MVSHVWRSNFDLYTVPLDQPRDHLVTMVTKKEPARANRLVLDEIPAVRRDVLRFEKLPIEIRSGRTLAHLYVLRVPGCPVEPREYLENVPVDLSGAGHNRPAARWSVGRLEVRSRDLCHSIQPRVRS